MVQSILECALGVARDHGGLAIERVSVEIGALQLVAPEALEFAFEAAKKGTLAENGVLEWHEVVARIECEACGACFEPEDLFWACPECGAVGGRVLAGDDLVLKSVELLEPDAQKEIADED